MKAVGCVPKKSIFEIIRGKQVGIVCHVLHIELIDYCESNSLPGINFFIPIPAILFHWQITFSPEFREKPICFDVISLVLDLKNRVQLCRSWSASVRYFILCGIK